MAFLDKYAMIFVLHLLWVPKILFITRKIKFIIFS